MTEKLIKKREDLANELLTKKISNEDINEIEAKVNAYREELKAEKESKYADDRKAITAKITLLDELIEDAKAEEVAEEKCEMPTPAPEVPGNNY